VVLLQGIVTFAHSLHCAYLTAIFHGMEGEVDLGDWLLLVDRPDRIIDLDSAGSAINHGGLILSIHDQERVGTRAGLSWLA
jgi:hypothetical protein